MSACACPPNADAVACAALRDYGHAPVGPSEERDCPCGCHCCLGARGAGDCALCDAADAIDRKADEKLDAERDAALEPREPDEDEAHDAEDDG